MKFRPEADIWPMMSDAELASLGEDIRQHGQREAIKLYEGDILDGRNRWTAMTRLGLTPHLEAVSPSSPLAYVVSLNQQRRHLSSSQLAIAAARALPFYEAEAKSRQLVGKSLLKETLASNEAKVDQGKSAETAAEAFGISRAQVERAKTVVEKGASSLADAVLKKEISVDTAANIVKRSVDPETQERLLEASRKSKTYNRLHALTGAVEWYTPPQYVDAAREVMGGIDLDPATSIRAQETVKAKRFFTADEDGLTKKWKGRVWLNPPYAMPFIRQFAEKLTDSILEGSVSQAIILTNNATDTEWFDLLLSVADGICFTKGRIRFINGIHDGENNSPTHGQAFCYFGENVEKFKAVFAGFGYRMLVRG